MKTFQATREKKTFWRQCCWLSCNKKFFTNYFLQAKIGRNNSVWTDGGSFEVIFDTNLKFKSNSMTGYCRWKFKTFLEIFELPRKCEFRLILLIPLLLSENKKKKKHLQWTAAFNLSLILIIFMRKNCMKLDWKQRKLIKCQTTLKGYHKISPPPCLLFFSLKWGEEQW